MAANTFAGGLETQAAVRNLCLRVKAGVTLQTELAPFAAYQKHAVGAAMGIVTTDAAFDLYGRVFVHKGAALLHVTVHASFRSRLVEAGQIFVPCGLWQSEHLISPSGTRWCSGNANLA